MVTVSQEEMIYAFTFHKNYTEDVCAIMRAMFTDVSFSGAVVEHEKNIALRELQTDASYSGSPYDVFVQKRDAHLYGDHPVARDPVATRDAIARITAQDLRDAFLQYYRSEAMHIGSVGPIERRVVQQYLGINPSDADRASMQQSSAAPLALTGFHRQTIDTGSDGSGTIASWVVVVQKDEYEDTISCNVMGEILGWKFMHYMRDQRGASYDASLREAHYTTFCVFHFEATLPHRAQERALQIYRAFWATVDITHSDVRRAQRNLCVENDFVMDSVASLAESLALENVHYTLRSGEVIMPHEENAMIRKVRHADCRALHERWFHGNDVRFYSGTY